MRTLKQIYEPEATPHIPLPTLVQQIRDDWKKPYFGAVPYLQAMATMCSFNDSYGYDDGKTIGLYFLCNAQTWRGPVAKAVKAEIKRQLGIK
jgi:hypothetical protein